MSTSCIILLQQQESRLLVFVSNCFPQELIGAERRLETLKGNRVPVTT